MKTQVRPNYTPQVRAAALEAVAQGKPIARVANEMCIPDQTLHNWIKAHRQGRAVQHRSDANAPENEVGQLREDLARVEAERDALAAAVAYFARRATAVS